jgi:uncharacterized protein DUF4203
MHIAAIFVGIVLLAFGKRLFWLCVAAIGFVVAAHIAAVVLIHQPEGVRLAAALLVGVLGALTAIFLQKVAIAGAGFLAGGYFLMILMNASAAHADERAWIAFLIGGIIGAVLMVLAFDWALIILSSMMGAHLIVAHLHLARPAASLGFIALLVVGIVIQANLGERRKDKP